MAGSCLGIGWEVGLAYLVCWKVVSSGNDVLEIDVFLFAEGCWFVWRWSYRLDCVGVRGNSLNWGG